MSQCGVCSGLGHIHYENHGSEPSNAPQSILQQASPRWTLRIFGDSNKAAHPAMFQQQGQPTHQQQQALLEQHHRQAAQQQSQRQAMAALSMQYGQPSSWGMRVIHSVWYLGAFFLWLFWSCYYDDLISLSDAEHTDFTHRTIDALFTLLGWVYAKDGSKSQAYSEAFSALGVCFVLSDMRLGRVTICNTEKRIQQLLEAIRGFLAKGSVTVPEALKLRGQLQFACGQVLGRQFRIFLSILTDYAYGDSTPLLPPTCTAALENFAWMLENSSPRAISVDGQRPMYLSTDACYNPQDDWKCGIGGMLFNHKGQLLAGFSHRLGANDRNLLGEGSSDTIIMAAEFVAVVCAISAWQDRLMNVPLVLCIDNNACRDILISAKGRSPLMRKLLAHYLRVEHKVGYTPWVARVPSPSNCADAPSKPLSAQIQFCFHGVG